MAPGPSVTRDSRPSPALTVSEDTLNPPPGPAPSSSIATSAMPELGSSTGTSTSGMGRALQSGRKYMMKYIETVTAYWPRVAMALRARASVPRAVLATGKHSRGGTRD